MTMACCLCQSHALGTSSPLPRPSATPSGAKPNSCVEVFPCVARFSLMSTLHSAKRRLPSVSAITCVAWAGPLRNDRNRIVIHASSNCNDIGLHERGQSHAEDRRAFLIRPTRKGRAAKETTVRILDVQQEAFLAPLSALERRALAEMGY